MNSDTLEYIIKPQRGGRNMIYRALIVIGAIAFFISSLIICAALLPPILFPGAALLSLSISAAIGFILCLLTLIEYEIDIGRTEISVVKIVGKRWRRALIDLPISQIRELGYYDDDAYEGLSKKAIERSISCISSFSAPEIYYALFEMDGKLGILCFEADERAIARLRSLNPRAFRQAANK